MAGREGTTLGPYRLTRRLGGGGAGEVYLAEGPAQGGAVGAAAVKVLRGSASDEAAREIARQAHAISSLHLAHVLPVYGVGEEHGAIYIAMAYAPGGSLGTSVGPGGVGALPLPLGASTVARLISQTARAVQAVHERGLVHGDLKPENLFVRTAPHGGPMAAAADFGQAAVVSAAAAAAAAGDATWAGAALRCAAPEQLSGPALPASDQYALATVAYLLLTGRYPFAGDARALGLALLHQPPPPPTQIDPALSPEAEATLLRALAKAPAARFPTLAAFVEALDEGLAASKGASASQMFSLLAGAAPPAGSSAPGDSRKYAAAGPHAALAGGNVSGIHRMPATAPAGPAASGARRTGRGRSAQARPAGGPWQRLGARQRMAVLVACAVALIMVAVGGLGLRALSSGPGTGTPLPNFGGQDFVPTLTPNVVQVATARAIAQADLAELTAATSKPPIFSDSLKNDGQHWPVDGKSTFFGSDGRLHLVNQNAHEILTINQPVSTPANVAVTVDLTFLRGNAGDPAGLRFRVGPGTDGTTGFYAVLISPEGRYELWRFDQSHWAILSSGYTDAVRPGLGQTNTLAILARGDRFLVFVNGQYIATVFDNVLPGGRTTQMGPIVIYSGDEIAYANYAVYAVE